MPIRQRPDAAMPRHLTAPDNFSAATDRARLREEFPAISEGTVARVSHRTIETLEGAKMWAAYWAEQEFLATNDLRREARDGQYIVDADTGMPMYTHYTDPIKGHYREPSVREGFRKIDHF